MLEDSLLWRRLLGLAIAKKVADQHRGTIRALNRDDGHSGCVIEVRLPFLQAEDWTADREVTADLRVGKGGEKGDGAVTPEPGE